ncbi:membrane protein insertion efficiency factor YidD [Massilimaliae timonensis]|uniref:Putative membrane protein insertion efficiency factor n=1 Tax=Massiliimalia timonensis TaxID=1987501 RepID=A0A8J6PCG8_9FIRM|nr:membrane protein insertion efficiency factor YidD [Massiliimalia timonensis]MBC8610898.1 membrane protein insertion efficiency factor YidD [Massiliimalia timonensis]
MKRIFVLFVRFYQKFLSVLKPPCCRFYPTCSQYAIEAFKRHGAVKGLILTVWRVCRCNPWNVGGIDYVPKKFQLSRKNNHEKPE